MPSSWKEAKIIRVWKTGPGKRAVFWTEQELKSASKAVAGLSYYEFSELAEFAELAELAEFAELTECFSLAVSWLPLSLFLASYHARLENTLGSDYESLQKQL